VKIQDEEEKVINVKYERKEIEEALIKQNIKHYRKVYDTLVYKDRIYRELLKDEIRNKILIGILRCNECNNVEVYNFLKLLIVKIK